MRDLEKLNIQDINYGMWEKIKKIWVGIIIDKSLKKYIVEVRKIEDRIMLIKLALGKNEINIVSAYDPHIGLEESVK